MQILLFSDFIKFTALLPIKTDAPQRTHSKPNGEQKKDNEYTLLGPLFIVCIGPDTGMK